MNATPAASEPDELATLREEFPGFRIWREMIGDRVRYIARSMHPDTGPHTVVTADLDDLCAVLGDGAEQPEPASLQPVTAGGPNIARMYSYWIGGKDNFEADRLAADSVLADFPQVAEVARSNREYVIRAVRHVAAQGITQYLDIGTGLPSSPAVHEIARQADPTSRVAYIDNDPVVLSHARALLATGPRVIVVPGDMRQPGAILGSPRLRSLIDLDEPVCVILASVLHFVTAAEADAIVAAFVAAMAPGSFLVLSAGTSTGTDPVLIDRLAAAYQDAAAVTGRTEAEITAYFSGLQTEPSGLTDVWAWRPDVRHRWPPSGARILGAVARKPASLAAAASAGIGRPR
jgi:O-methyltransferase involved in polyketide biosynthesis